MLIEALAKSFFYGTLWGLGGYLYSGCWLLILASSPGGRVVLRAAFSRREMRELLPEPTIAPPKPSNVVPFRRRQSMAPIEQSIEAAE